MLLCADYDLNQEQCKLALAFVDNPDIIPRGDVSCAMPECAWLRAA